MKIKLKIKLDNKGKPYKEKDLRWLFNQKSFYSNLNKFPTLSQFRELKKCLYYLNKGEYMKIDNFAKFISDGMKTKFLERQRYILNVKKSNGLLGTIVRYGLHNIDKQVKGFTSDNNPAKNHGGKYSSGSKNFIKYQGLTEEEKQQKINEVHSKISKSNKENGNNDCTLEYYLKRGYNENEAKRLLSERQSTFSLEKCIERYGEEGLIIFNQRQQKWQKTLQSKPKEELERINRDKGKGEHIGWSIDLIRKKNYWAKNTETILYYIKFYNSRDVFYKIGITSQGIISRWGSQSIFEVKNGLSYNVIYTEKMPYDKAFYKEQYILSKNNRVTKKYNHFSSTECFDEDILQNILKINKKDLENFTTNFKNKYGLK